MKSILFKFETYSLTAILTFVLLLTLVVNIPKYSVAQDQTAKLEYKLQLLPDDTAKVNVLLKLGEKYCSIENDKALMYLQKSFTIATSINYTVGIGKSLLWQGRVYYYKDDYPLSDYYLSKARDVLENTNELESIGFIDFAKGENYRIMGDYIRAMESYSSALKIAEGLEDKKSMSTYYNSIGKVFLDRNEPAKAKEYFQSVLKQKRTIKDQNGISKIYTCLGIACEKLNQLDSSLWYHNQALIIRTNLKTERAIAGTEYNKASVLIKMQLYEEAEKSLVKALTIFTKLEEKTGMIITNLKLAEARNGLGKPDAVDIANDALKMAKSIGNPNLISHAFEILSGIYYYQKKYKESYEYLEYHNSIQDSILTTEKERMLTEFEAKFQSEKKDNQIKLLKSQTEIQRKNNLLLIVLIIVFASVTILLFFLFKLKSTAFKRQQLLLEQETIIHNQQAKITENEKQFLEEQLESKNRELASKALEMLRYTDAISSIIEKLENLNNTIDCNLETENPIKDIIHELEHHTKQNIWNEFEKIFKNIHSGFYDKLLDICPELTATEIKTAALLRLNLTTKEIAAIAFKSEGGIKTTRYRLRKKLGLTNDDKLVPFLMQI